MRWPREYRYALRGALRARDEVAWRLAARLEFAVAVEVLQQIGSYAGLAAILGLAVLAALYFSQARDMRRLREAADEREAAAVAAPVGQPARPAVQRPAAAVPAGAVPAAPSKAAPTKGAVPGTPAAAPARASVAATAAGAASKGASPAKPQVPGSVPAGSPGTGPAAPATTPGVPGAAPGGAPGTAPDGAPGAMPGSAPPVVPEEPPAAKPGAPAVAPADVPAAPVSPGAAPPTPVASEAAGAGPVSPQARPPARAMPAATGARPGSTARGVPPRLPVVPRRPMPARPPIGGRPRTLREAAEAAGPRPWYRRLEPRYLVLVIAGVLIVGGGVAYGVVSLLSGEEPATPTAVQPDAGAGGDGGDRDRGTDAPPLDPSSVTVAVLNGTSTPGLAAEVGNTVESAGFQQGNVANATDQEAAESVVLYAEGSDEAAREVGKELDISQIQPIDPENQALAGDAPVVVVVGQDQVEG